MVAFYDVVVPERVDSGGDMVSEGDTGWSRRDTRGASSSGQMDKSEAWRGTEEYVREQETERDKDKSWH